MLTYATLKHNHGQKGAAGNNCNGNNHCKGK